MGKLAEGYCLKILTKDQNMSIYVICLDTNEEREILFTKLRALKIMSQHQNGEFVFLKANGTNGKKNKKKQQQTLSDMMNDHKKVKENKVGALSDGYWIVLQNWSQCSKKCDGGTSTFQRMCIPPKQGGKPCVGDAVMVKPCNTKPCPHAIEDKEALAKNQHVEILKPIVKIMPFTNHPQRFTLCKIKESDMMIFEDGKDPIKQNEPLFKGKKIDQNSGIQIPSRVVMNTKTLTIFAGSEFETLYMSFSLKKTKFLKFGKDKERKNCFKLFETVSRYATLCPFNSGSSADLDQWENDFFTFKDKCSRSNNELDEESKKKLEDKIKEKMEKAKQEASLEFAEERKKKKAENNEENVILVKQTEATAMKAIEKELNLEALIKAEAEEKNKAEEIQLLKVIESEKKKKECVAKAIKEKQLENTMLEKAEEIKDTINTIKAEAAQQVLKKREKLRELINSINKKAELKRNKLRQQLQTVRMSIASDIGKAYKKGDMTRCKNANSNEKVRSDYCIATFSDDFAQLSYCRESDDFCEVCCQAEFGDMLIKEKEECLKKENCTNKPNKPARKDDKDDIEREISGTNGKYRKQKSIAIE